MPGIIIHPGEKIESLGKNQLRIIQNRNNYRFSMDSVILAKFVHTKKREKIIDLGTGCGIIPLLIYNQDIDNFIYAIEIQEKLADIAKRNVILNHLEKSIYVINEDIKKLKKQFPAESFDVITANPPYIAAGKGKISVNPEQLLARHEINMTLDKMAAIGSYLLKKRGRFYLIHRADSLISVIMTLKKYKLEPKTLQFVYTRKNNNARRFLLEARKNGGIELKVPAALFLDR